MTIDSELRTLHAQINALQRGMDQMKRDIERRPLRMAGGGSTSIYTLTIIGGNVLSDAITQGIKYSSSQITSVPSAYDPNVDTSFIDGIGIATLTINGALQTGNVLVVNDTRSIGATAVVVGWVIETIPTTVSILVGAGPETVSCYLALSP